jgi:transglutaminase-like putative cysteine protease
MVRRWLESIGAPIKQLVEGGGLGALEAIGSPVQGVVEGMGAVVKGSLPFHTAPRIEEVNPYPAEIRYVKIPNGDAGTLATLKIMKQLCLGPWGAHNPQIALLANQIRDGFPSRSYEAEAQALLDWVKQNVRYKLDAAGLEWVQTPTYTLKRKAGDCDCLSTLLCSLALASGFKAGFRTVRGDPGRKDFSHVYSVIGITRNHETKWYGADATQRQSRLGWDPPGIAPQDMATWVIDPTLED